MFNKVLVAIDEDEMSQKVIEATLSIVKKSVDAHITLVNVSKDNVAGCLMYVPKDFLEVALKKVEQASVETLEKAKSNLLSSEEVSIDTVNLKGDPAQQILEYTQAHEHDLIIIGSRGLSGMKGVMLGSVSHKVSQLSTCPVLIVH